MFMLPICGDKVLGQAKGSLRIAGQFVVTPSGCVGAGFVEEGRRECVIPDDEKASFIWE